MCGSVAEFNDAAGNLVVVRQVSFTLLISLIMRLQSKSVREEHFVHILGEVISCAPGGMWLHGKNLKELTEGHLPEWSLQLNLTQQAETYWVQT